MEAGILYALVQNITITTLYTDGLVKTIVKKKWWKTCNYKTNGSIYNNGFRRTRRYFKVQ